ncbi:hypothetical protein ACQI4L_05580 [Mycolicibacterium litorale]|uniref:hypothetical protein n=1 Tax=Mycolicibacterium litorale TaxID=758802 RepID=UPI003CEEC6D8
MHAYPFIHPWQLAAAWTTAHRSARVVVLSTEVVRAEPVAAHWWSRQQTLPDSRSHYYPSRCVYLEGSALSRMMDHL